MKKNLITGITGFVGSHLADYILSKNEAVYGLAKWRSSRESIEHIKDKITLLSCDLLDLSSVLSCLQSVKPEYIYHLAAQSFVTDSFSQPSITLQTNVIGTLNLLEAVRILKQKEGYDPIIHVCSNSEVYGQVKEDEVPIKETNQFRPANPYAVSKVGEDKRIG